MSSKLNIYNAVITTLKAAQAAGQPLAFVKNIFTGYFDALDNVPAQGWPAIVVEVDGDDEKYFTTGTTPAIKSDFKLFVSCVIKEAKPGLGIIGDATQKPPVIGLLEFVDKVKNVLQADMTLGGGLGMQKVMFPQTQFSFLFYPVREGKIHVTLDSQLTTTSH